jgi:hypothetical protein
MTMNHLVLLGDSIFDNRAYVGGEPAVIDQMQQKLGSTWQASLLAVDGDTTAEVPQQLRKLPKDCSHLVLSIGGNDALRSLDLMTAPTANVMTALAELAKIVAAFKHRYTSLLDQLLVLNKPLLVCTVYDSVPGLSDALKVGLALFNDVILKTAIAKGVPVLDLRMICTVASDYSVQSPIEPSSQGGEKIASRIADLMLKHDFTVRGCVVFN